MAQLPMKNTWWLWLQVVLLLRPGGPALSGGLSAV